MAADPSRTTSAEARLAEARAMEAEARTVYEAACRGSDPVAVHAAREKLSGIEVTVGQLHAAVSAAQPPGGQCMSHDPAAHAHAILVSAVCLADALCQSQDTCRDFNIAAVAACATARLTPGWQPSAADQSVIYALAVGLFNAPSGSTLPYMRQVLG